jgi:NAD(P)-dependent dehydrogenase (short-subunit alcohol dehydrogenase family)
MTITERLFGLAGKVALVTGAGSGIGQAIALALAEAGAAVVLVGRRRQPLEETASRVAAGGGRAAALPCDLAEHEALLQCAAQAGDAFGPPDILVSAAGVNLRRPIDEVRPDDWHATLRINLDAPFFLAQRLVPAMIARRWGRIINIASLQSVRAFADGSAYGASKGAVMQLTRAQAQAWSRHGVNANAIAPGFFPTALTAPVFDDPARSRELAARTFVGRNGVLADLAGAAIFLASAASDYVTGQTLFVDGGFTAG